MTKLSEALLKVKWNGVVDRGAYPGILQMLLEGVAIRSPYHVLVVDVPRLDARWRHEEAGGEPGPR